MNVTVIGTGFVGVVTAAVLASFKNKVIGLDIDENKVAALRQGKVPFYEPELEELLLSEQDKGFLSFTTDYQSAIKDTEVILIAVGTPSTSEGKADMSYVFSACESLAPHLKDDAIVVVKSTVPPGTLEKVKEIISQKSDKSFKLASVPEFLREGHAVSDTLRPNRVVIGASEEDVFTKLEELHAPFKAPVVRVSPESAQLAKYAANAYLAMRITFINQISDLCEQNGAVVDDIVEAIGYDERIGSHYWYPGFGYGGSCFPKDVRELAYYSRTIGLGDNLFNKIHELNELRIPALMNQIESAVGGWQGKKAAVLGLAFKPNTDDMREAPSIKVVPELINAGAEVAGYDPKALDNAKHYFSKLENIRLFDRVDDALEEADIIFALVEWPEIVKHEFSQAKIAGKDQWFVDARNQFNKEEIEKIGYKYIGIGR